MSDDSSQSGFANKEHQTNYSHSGGAKPIGFVVSADVKHHAYLFYFTVRIATPNRDTTAKCSVSAPNDRTNSEFRTRSCVKAEVAVLGYFFCGRKATRSTPADTQSLQPGMACRRKVRKVRAGGQCCSALNCTNRRYKCPGMSFFTCPKDEARCKEWVLRSGRYDLLRKDVAKLHRTCLFCSNHFEDSQFMNPQEKKRLVWNAVPTLFNVPDQPPSVTFKQTVPKTKDNTSFDKMDSDDSWETSAVTIEIDVAEELPVSCGTEKDEQDCSKEIRSPLLTECKEQLMDNNLSVSDIRTSDTTSSHTCFTASDVSSKTSSGCQPLFDGDNSKVLQPSPAAVISSSPASLTTPSVCQQGPPAFVQLSHLKSHMASSHRKKQSAGSPRGDCDLGNHGNRNHKTSTDKFVWVPLADKVSRPVYVDVVEYSKAFTAVTNLNGHKLQIICHKRHVCDICGETFPFASHLEEHKMIHLEEGKWNHTGHKCHVCHVCGEAFPKAYDLKVHKRIHKPFVCDVCNQAYTDADYLKVHKMIHSGDKPFVCDVCSRTFSVASYLRQHKRLIHAGHKCNACNVCGKAFKRASLLKLHKMTSAGCKPYVCDVCDGAFNDAGNLNRHKEIHSGHKPFVCDVCGETFSLASYLAQHKMIHTSYKPFVCGACGKAFLTASVLEEHQRTHTCHKLEQHQRTHTCHKLEQHQRAHTGHQI